MKKRLIAIFMICLLILPALAACSGGQGENANGSQANAKTTEANQADVGTKIFTDSVGREVEVPAQIDKIAVSGPLAQMYVFALCPDKIVGLSSSFSDDAREFIDEKYFNLPELGQLYGGKGDLNSETLIATGAQVIVDVGETKDSIKEDMDEIQEQVGIPTVHIFADLESSGDAFRKLGELVGMEDDAEEIASFCDEIYKRTKDIADSVDKVDLLYLSGDLGQNVLAKGSYHSEVIDLLANNVAVVDNPSSKGIGNEVDMEQLLNWNPDYILFAPQSIYSIVEEEDEWENMKAIEDGHYYEVPFGPYNWMGSPPSCQRYLGMMWMAKLLYPKEADYDLYEDVAKFYELFFHTELTEGQYENLVGNSIIKAEIQEAVAD